MDDLTASRVAPAQDNVVTIPEEILIDEEKESPPNSPTSTAPLRREVIAIDTDDGNANTDEDCVEEVMEDKEDGVVAEAGGSKPKKRVRFHEPLIESIRHFETEEEERGAQREAHTAISCHAATR